MKIPEQTSDYLFKLTPDADNGWLGIQLRSLSSFATLVALIAIASAACSSNSSQPSPPLTTEEQHGRELFQASCAICHNAYKKEPLPGPPLVAMFRKKELPSGLPATDDHVRDTILTGRRNMPAFKAVLDERQLNELLAYLHTL